LQSVPDDNSKITPPAAPSNACVDDQNDDETDLVGDGFFDSLLYNKNPDIVRKEANTNFNKQFEQKCSLQESKEKI
jgi:hypothetical protein